MYTAPKAVIRHNGHFCLAIKKPSATGIFGHFVGERKLAVAPLVSHLHSGLAVGLQRAMIIRSNLHRKLCFKRRINLDIKYPVYNPPEAILRVW